MLPHRFRMAGRAKGGNGEVGGVGVLCVRSSGGVGNDANLCLFVCLFVVSMGVYLRFIRLWDIGLAWT